MRRSIVVFSLSFIVLLSLFLAGCTTGKAVSDAELFAELNNLSTEELDTLIEGGVAKERGALAGQAYQTVLSNTRAIKKVARVDTKALAIVANQLKQEKEHGFCGNDKVEFGEECDGTNYGGKSCVTEGFVAGQIQCKNCKIDTSKCMPKVCTPQKLYCSDSKGNLVEGEPYYMRCTKGGEGYFSPVRCFGDNICLEKGGKAACLPKEEQKEPKPVEEPKKEEAPIEAPKDVCGKFSQLGKYKFKPCDEFIGPLGINFRVNGIDQYDQVKGDYVDAFGNVVLKNKAILGSTIPKYAYYGLKLYSLSKEIMVLTDNPKDICSPDVGIICSLYLPNEAIEGDIMVSENGYFGKTNNPQYPQLATCAAKDLANAVVHTSQFLGLPQPEKGLSQMYIFLDKEPFASGTSSGPISIWFYKKGDQQVDYEVSQCEKKIQSGNFAKGDHEVTHLLSRDLDVPLTFNEGLANYVPRVLNDEIPKGWETKGEIWNYKESVCKENGFTKGVTVYAYIKHYNAQFGDYHMYTSGECFWQKLVYDYGQDILQQVMGVLKNNVGKNKSFEESLKEAGVDTSKYQPWGLGENK